MFHSRSSLVVFGAEGCTGSGHRLWRMGGPRRPRWRAWRGEPPGAGPRPWPMGGRGKAAPRPLVPYGHLPWRMRGSRSRPRARRSMRLTNNCGPDIGRPDATQVRCARFPCCRFECQVILASFPRLSSEVAIMYRNRSLKWMSLSDGGGFGIGGPSRMTGLISGSSPWRALQSRAYSASLITHSDWRAAFDQNNRNRSHRSISMNRRFTQRSPGSIDKTS